MKGTPLIGFGDADAFYASAEAVRRPWLAKLPVGVLGNQGACVIARNYPMKRFGIKVGEPVWEAKRKCPDGGGHGLHPIHLLSVHQTAS